MLYVSSAMRHVLCMLHTPIYIEVDTLQSGEHHCDDDDDDNGCLK